MAEKRAIIFVNGDPPDEAFCRKLLGPEDYLIAVDGGLRFPLSLNRLPDILIGDLDSVEESQLAIIQNMGIPILRLDVHKDETDLEVAIQHAIDAGFAVIRIIAGWGKRIDHSLTNLLILTKPQWSHIDIRLIYENMEAFIGRNGMKFEGQKGDLISLIPLDEEVVNVTTIGLEYELSHESLFRWNARGISNVLLSETAEIYFSSGNLLCVHINQDSNSLYKG